MPLHSPNGYTRIAVLPHHPTPKSHPSAPYHTVIGPQLKSNQTRTQLLPISLGHSATPGHRAPQQLEPLGRAEVCESSDKLNELQRVRDHMKVTPFPTAAVTTLHSDHSAVAPPTLCTLPRLYCSPSGPVPARTEPELRGQPHSRPSAETVPSPRRLHSVLPLTRRRRAAERANGRVPPRRRQPIGTREVGVARRRALRPLRTMRERTALSGASPAPFLPRGAAAAGSLTCGGHGGGGGGTRGPDRPGGAAERAGSPAQAGAAAIRRWKRKRLLRRERRTVWEQCGCALGTGAPARQTGVGRAGPKAGLPLFEPRGPQAGLGGARPGYELWEVAVCILCPLLAPPAGSEALWALSTLVALCAAPDVLTLQCLLGAVAPRFTTQCLGSFMCLQVLPWLFKSCLLEGRNPVAEGFNGCKRWCLSYRRVSDLTK